MFFKHLWKTWEKNIFIFLILILLTNGFILIKIKTEENNCLEIKYVTASECICIHKPIRLCDYYKLMHMTNVMD